MIVQLTFASRSAPTGHPNWSWRAMWTAAADRWIRTWALAGLQSLPVRRCVVPPCRRWGGPTGTAGTSRGSRRASAASCACGGGSRSPWGVARNGRFHTFRRYPVRTPHRRPAWPSSGVGIRTRRPCRCCARWAWVSEHVPAPEWLAVVGIREMTMVFQSHSARPTAEPRRCVHVHLAAPAPAPRWAPVDVVAVRDPML